MKWKQAVINDKPQPEGIQCDEYRIGRFNKGSKYGAWFECELIGYFGTAGEAKDACESHLRSMSVEHRNDDSA